MILFFGTRLRTRVLGEGTFPCPFCFVPRAFTRSTSRTWVHLFWIPLVPLGGAHEEVRCSVCGGRWAPAVLQGESLA